jgi:hypothetical protein
MVIPFTSRRDRRKHSPDTVIRNLRDENVKLLNRQAAADDFFAILWHDVVTTNAALGQEKQARGDAEEAAAQMRMERDEWRDKALALQARFGPQIAAEANANRIDVPPMVRPIDGPEDEATGPINVRALWDARDAGLLGPVTDPGRAAT